MCQIGGGTWPKLGVGGGIWSNFLKKPHIEGGNRRDSGGGGRHRRLDF
jgi:hypothetical protein